MAGKKPKVAARNALRLAEMILLAVGADFTPEETSKACAIVIGGLALNMAAKTSAISVINAMYKHAKRVTR